MIGGDPALHLAALLAAILLDALFGEPDWLWRRLPHPIVLIGRAVSALDRGWNHAYASDFAKRLAGSAALAVLIAGAVALGLTIEGLLPDGWPELAMEALIAGILIAQKSLYSHVKAVATGLRKSLAEGRSAVAMIVGRDPETLNEAGVSRAAIESCAENLSDGIVAPVFWFAVAGLPGIMAYKAINTADSMIGHRTPRHEAFGWASARIDDLVNLPASRLSAVLIALSAALTGGRFGAAVLAVLRDAGRHRSPNAGWPEAAMAGALGIALAGPRIYAGATVDDAWMNGSGRRDATAQDIDRALRLLVGVCVLQALIVAGLLGLFLWL